MGVTKNILNNSRLVEVKVDDNHKKNWYAFATTYEYHYFGRQVALVSFNSSKCEVSVVQTFSPWSYVRNDKDEFFCKISKVEDQIHGVYIIELDNLQALFIEQETNLNIKSGQGKLSSGFAGGNITAKGFAQMLEANIVQIQNGMVNKLWQQNSRLQNNKPTTFPVWTTKTSTKIKTIK